MSVFLIRCIVIDKMMIQLGEDFSIILQEFIRLIFFFFFGAGMYNMPCSCLWVGLCCLCQVFIESERCLASECLVWQLFNLKGVMFFHSFCRNREIKRIKGRVRAGNSFAFICNDISELEHSNQVNLPRVTVIMPLKGFGEHNLHNWRSQVSFFLFPF